MTGRDLEVWLAAPAPTRPPTDELIWGAAVVEPADFDHDYRPPVRTEVVYIDRPAVNVTVHGPGTGGVVAVALIRAVAAIPVAVAVGVAWLVTALLAWARRAIPGDGDRVAALGILGLLAAGWLAVVLLFAPWRVNLITFGVLTVVFGAAGAYRRTAGERTR